jgi:hypothetical protein
MMRGTIVFRGLAALLFVSALVLGCSGNQPFTAVSTCGAIDYYPVVQLLYPVPGSTGVPVDVGVLMYQGTPIGASPGPASVPISLGVGPSPPITTVPTSVPSPLPSPAATPHQPAGSAYAVALSTLSPDTVYQVFATQNVGGCVKPGMTVLTNIGTFTTQ